MTALDVSSNLMDSMIDMSDKSFEIIILNKNYLRFLPFDMIPPVVKHLSVDQNDLTRIEIDAPMPNLLTFSAEENDISFVDIEFPLISLSSLNLSKNRLKSDTGLHQHMLPSLKHLNLSYNDIQILSPLPPTLETLNVGFCRIKLLPSRLPPNLLTLYALDNQLKNGCLPSFWGNSLRILNLSKNQLKEFPKKLPDSLEELFLSRNEIVKIPYILPTNLRVLTMGKNKIREIPKKTNVMLDLLVIPDNQLTRDFSKEPVSWSKQMIEIGNWNGKIHNVSQKMIRKCWKRYLLQKRLRHLYRSRTILEELLMVALHPDHILQTDTFSPEWVNIMANQKSL